MTECFGTGSKKVRGRAQRSTDLIEAMYEIAEASQPITGRGVGYKLFTEGKIPSMSRPNMVTGSSRKPARRESSRGIGS